MCVPAIFCARAVLAVARFFASDRLVMDFPTDFTHPHDQERRDAVAATWCLATSQTGATRPAATPDLKPARCKGLTPDLGSGSIDQEVTSMCKRVDGCASALVLPHSG